MATLFQQVNLGVICALALMVSCEKQDGTPECSDSCGDCQYVCSYGTVASGAIIKEGALCSVDQTDADSDCLAECEGEFGANNCDFHDASEIPCSGNGEEGTGDTGGGMCQETTSCTNWDPASNVTLTSGVYHVSNGFWNNLIDDASPLLDCDDARFKLQTGGGWKLDEVSSGDLADELGLEDDDEIEEIDGVAVDDFQDILDAFGELRYEIVGTEIDVKIKRNGRPKTLTYTVDYAT